MSDYDFLVEIIQEFESLGLAWAIEQIRNCHQAASCLFPGQGDFQGGFPGGGPRGGPGP